MTRGVQGHWMLSLVEAESFHFLAWALLSLLFRVAMPHFGQITTTERNVEILKVHEGQEVEAKPFQYRFLLWQRALRTPSVLSLDRFPDTSRVRCSLASLAHFSDHSGFWACKVDLFSTHLHAKLLPQRISQGINSNNNSKTKQTNPKPTNQKT